MEEPRTEVLRWFEEAFEGLRDEMRAMAGGITQQQAMMAELMESSQADLRLIMVAESLPRLVDDAVRKALGDNSVSLLQFLDSSLGDFKDELRKREDSAREASERADAEQVAGLEAIRTAVIKELRPIARAIAQAVELQAEAKEEDAARLPALKASMTRTLRPLEEAAERSDQRLAEIANQLKKLVKAGDPPPRPDGGGSVPSPRSPSGASVRNASVRNASVRNGSPAKTRPVSRRR